MVGMQSVITRDILPYCKVAGNPARILGFNLKGAQRSPHEAQWLEEMDAFFHEDIERNRFSQNPIKKEVYTFLQQYPDALIKVKS